MNRRRLSALLILLIFTVVTMLVFLGKATLNEGFQFGSALVSLLTAYGFMSRT